MRKLNVVVVEDEALVAEEIKDRLERIGHKVLFIADRGSEVISIVQSVENIDLILMDIRIKGDIDGIETARIIHEYSNVPVIFVSAHSDHATLDRSKQPAKYGYIIKPFDEQDLLMAIDLAIHRFEEEQFILDQKNRLYQLFESIGISMALVNSDLMIIETNQAFLNNTGHDIDSLTDKSIIDLFSGNTPTLSGIEELDWSEQKSHNFFSDLICMNNTLIPTNTRISRFISSNNKTYYWFIIDDISSIKKADELIFHHANYDALTDLPNRHLFYDRLQEAIKHADRDKTSLALIYIDLDNFKEINDSLGHAIGDQVLLKLCHKIQSCIRSTDTLARIGGDEFALILPGMTDYDRIEMVMNKINHAVKQPIQLKEHTLFTSISAGVTLYPEDADTISDLIKFSDQAMYSAKAQGKGRHVFFNITMKEDTENRHTISQKLRNALKNQEFELHYQPIIDLSNNKVFKVEALIRWNNADIGAIGPDIFIPIAEETGLIIDIGNWVFEQAIKTAQYFHTKTNIPLQISVNKSPIQFTHQEGSYPWQEKLLNLNLPSSAIAIEITESLLIQDSPLVKSRLLDYQKSGIEVSLDDFGTGFSSLAYLKEFDIDYLKIDRAFIKNLATDKNDQTLTEAIIVMAHKLHIKTIAEGVETEQQLNLLKQFGCDYIQGYYFSKPLTFDSLFTFLNQ